jgi:hypothetical protein
VLGQHAARLDRALHRHLLHAHRRSRFDLPFDPARDDAAQWCARDRFHPNAALYERWAQALAAHIELDLAQNPVRDAVLPGGFVPSTFLDLDDDPTGFGQLNSLP